MSRRLERECVGRAIEREGRDFQGAESAAREQISELGVAFHADRRDVDRPNAAFGEQLVVGCPHRRDDDTA